jgi:trimeric autotransporter adhesin
MNVLRISQHWLTFFLLTSATSMAQVGIGTTTPAASSVLELSSTSKGLLTPRMTEAQRTAISSPATGLIVYQTDGTIGLYHYNGSSWAIVGGSSSFYYADGTLSGNRTVSTTGGYTLTFSPKTIFSPLITAASGSGIGTSYTPSITAAANNDELVGVDINPTFVTGSYTGLKKYGLRVQGIHIGVGSGGEATNTVVGNSSLKSADQYSSNQTAIGYQTLTAMTAGTDNTAVGSMALKTLDYGWQNTAVGTKALYSLLNGYGRNTAVGHQAAYSEYQGTDNTAVGFQAMYAMRNTTGNVAVGSYALSTGVLNNYNVAIGYKALQYFLPEYSFTNPNIAIGPNAMRGSGSGTYRGSNNIAIGNGSIYNITTGVDNIGIGSGSLQQLSSGNENMGIGINSLGSLSSGTNNIGIGISALNSIATASRNLAIGNASAYGLTGENNTALGYFSQTTFSSTSGTNNTSVGYNSMTNLGAGSYNTAIGVSAGPSSGTLSNTSAIGYGASVTASNTIQLGNSSVTTVNTSGAVVAAGVTLTSDARLKQNIVSLSQAREKISTLNPVSYDKKRSMGEKEFDIHEYGFIAQELKKVLPLLVSEGTDADKLLSVNYTSLIALLTKALQEQDANIRQLETRISTLEKALNVKK